MGGDSLKGSKLFYEQRARDRGYSMIAGVDEAGRGPIAGPVVAACCSLSEHAFIEGIDDSKKLSAKKRFELYEILSKHPDVIYSVGIVPQDEIDRINIYQATIKAMIEAIDTMPEKPDYAIVDGMALPHPGVETEKVVKADTLSLYVGAASILAKVIRDNIMERYHKMWPYYKFDKNKGYGTKEHIDALRKYGPCDIHRRSFEPVKSLELMPC